MSLSDSPLRPSCLDSPRVPTSARSNAGWGILCLFLIVACIVSATPSHAQTSWTKYPGNPILTPGAPGTWDASQTFFQSVIYHDSTFMMWYGGDDGTLKFQIGRATSSDGISWQKDSLNPVVHLGPTGAWDDFEAWIPTVLFDGSGYRMWYLGAHGGFLNSVLQGYATSMDGRIWLKDSLNPTGPDIGSRSILFDGATFKCWSDSSSTNISIIYSTSIDGIHWTSYPQNPVLTPGAAGSWDQSSLGPACVIYDSTYYHMWYTSVTDYLNLRTAGIGYAVSNDGIHWKKYPGNPVLRGGAAGAWDASVFRPSVIKSGSLFRMWFSGDNPQITAIGYATAPLSRATIFTDRPSIDFQSIRPGTTSDTVYVAISNWGFTPLTISSLSHRLAEFRVSNLTAPPVTLKPIEETRLSVIFRPTQAGLTLQDTIFITSNDSLHPTMTIVLRGRGSAPVLPASATSIYVTDTASATVRLFVLDNKTGKAGPGISLTPHAPRLIEGLTVRRFDNGIYGTFSTATRTTLYHISSVNGDFDSVGQIPIGAVRAIAFSTGDSLFLVDSNKTLFVMKGITGSPSMVGTMNIQMSGLAFDPGTGELWGSARDSICIISTATGKAAFVGRGYPGIGHSSITFSPLGTLYGVYDNALVVVDRTTGEVTVIGPTGLSGPQHIAMRNDASAAAVAGSVDIARETTLDQNYPNPFNPSTTIAYSIPWGRESGVGSMETKLVVYDVLGREIAVLVNERKLPGRYEVRFDASGLASGIYFYTLQAGEFRQTKSLVLLR